MIELNPLVAAQLANLQTQYPGAAATPLPDGSVLIELPDLELVAGWNQPTTTAWFLVPMGYPAAAPDCFLADPGLRLGNGQQPQNTGMQVHPGTGVPHVWFSWHVQGWNPARDSLVSYARVIRDRLRRAL